MYRALWCGGRVVAKAKFLTPCEPSGAAVLCVKNMGDKRRPTPMFSGLVCERPESPGEIKKRKS
jgi:hypothetical protein